jgi:hypothetical protein
MLLKKIISSHLQEEIQGLHFFEDPFSILFNIKDSKFLQRII